MDKKEIVDSINKKSGKLLASYDEMEPKKVDVLPTSILPLDFALGIGGLPLGTVIDLFGMPSVGKSTLCFTVMAEAQRAGMSCAIIDAEYSYRPDYVASFGVDTKEIIVVQPDCLEEAGEAIETLIRSGVRFIVVDSISALIPKALVEADHGKSPMAMQARGVAQMLIKILSPLAKNQGILLCINQLRVNLMAMNPNDRYTVTGGWALKFYSTVRIEAKRLKAIMGRGDKHIGYNVGFHIKKNKESRPGGKCEIPYLFDKGFTKDGDIVSMALEKGLVKQKGAWLYYKEEKFNGKEKFAAYLDSELIEKQELTRLVFPETEEGSQ